MVRARAGAAGRLLANFGDTSHADMAIEAPFGALSRLGRLLHNSVAAEGCRGLDRPRPPASIPAGPQPQPRPIYAAPVTSSRKSPTLDVLGGAFPRD